MKSGGEWRVGWPVVLGSSIGLGTAANLHYYVSTFFVGGITAEFGWSRGDLAAVQAIALWGVLAAPFVGVAIDRFGLRPMLIIGMLALSAVYAAAANMPASVWAPLILFFLIQSVGQATGTIPHTKAITGWFVRHRGVALGLAITGIPLASALVSPLLSSVIAAYGWRAGYWLLAGMAMFLGLPAILLFVREKAQVTQIAPRAEANIDVLDSRPARAVITSRAFWLLMGAMIFVNVPGGGFLNQLAPMLSDKDFTINSAALIVSTFAGAVAIGRLLCGLLLDYFEPAYVAAFFTLCPAIGMAVLILNPALTVTTAIIGVALVGAQQGAELDLLAFFTARLFGQHHYGFLYGIGYTLSVLATSMGLFLFAKAHDWNGSYDYAIIASICTFVLGAVCFVQLRERTPLTGRAHA